MRQSTDSAWCKVATEKLLKLYQAPLLKCSVILGDTYNVYHTASFTTLCCNLCILMPLCRLAFLQNSVLPLTLVPFSICFLLLPGVPQAKLHQNFSCSFDLELNLSSTTVRKSSDIIYIKCYNDNLIHDILCYIALYIVFYICCLVLLDTSVFKTAGLIQLLFQTMEYLL